MNNNEKNVLIIGLGYVGLTLAVHLAKKGLNIFGVEIDKSIVESIKNRKAHFYEPGIDTLINKYYKKSFFVTEEIEKLKYDYIIISVGTPLQNGIKDPDMGYLSHALESIKDVYNGSTHIILRSTVAVGTTKTHVLPIIKNWNKNNGNEILLSFCPERTAEGVALLELETLPQIISGINNSSVQSASKLFVDVSNEVIESPSVEAAELAKLFNNVYRDVNFSIGNIFNHIAQSFNVDGKEMIEFANKGYNRSNIASPGFVGGPCIEKDSYILASNMENSLERSSIVTLREYNRKLEDDIVNWVRNNIKKESPILISGLAFKGNPPTSDLRGSNALKIVSELSNEYELFVHDYFVPHNILKRIDNVQLIENFDSIGTNKVDLFLILNNAKKYHQLDQIALSKILDTEGTIFDSWDVLPFSATKNFSTKTIGNYRIK